MASVSNRKIHQYAGVILYLGNTSWLYWLILFTVYRSNDDPMLSYDNYTHAVSHTPTSQIRCSPCPPTLRTTPTPASRHIHAPACPLAHARTLARTCSQKVFVLKPD